MDHAVGLVQVYLHLNGYFTVSEYPVLEERAGGAIRPVTDIDLVAVRLPGAGGLLPLRPAGRVAPARFDVDPMLGVDAGAAEMLIVEVKEGRAVLNDGTRNPRVLASVLSRFGCCGAGEQGEAVRALLRRGESRLPSGLRVRLMAFGSQLPGVAQPGYHPLALGHVVGYLESHIRRHWQVLRHAHAKSPVFGLLLAMEKARRGLAAARSEPPEPDTPGDPAAA